MKHSSPLYTILLAGVLLCQSIFLMGAVISGGGGSSTASWPTSSTTKIITWATSFANALGIGDGTDYWAIYVDATDGPIIQCVVGSVAGDCDKGHTINVTYKSFVADASGNRLLNFEPNASAAKDQYALGTKKVRKYVYFPASSFVGDGTNCPAASTAVTINSGPKLLTTICGSGANGDMDFDVVMPNNWDGGTLEFEPDYIQTAANTSAMNSDIKAQCRGAGETPSSTWGTAIAIDDAAVTGSNARDKTLSAAVTPAGTCAAGDHLFVRYTLDVTGTTTPEATLHFLGAGMYYYVSSLSN